MDLMTKTSLIHVSEAVSPVTAEGTTLAHPSVHNPDPGFPIMAIAIIGIVATAFLLVSYYVFVIKCCLNWHRIDLLSRFSLSRGGGGRHDETLLVYSPAVEPRGLDEAAIRSIPVLKFKNRGSKSKDLGERSFCECAVCLNEFQEDEKLKIIPHCSHVFHIDCIDIWLQNNANCPLCRISISSTAAMVLPDLLIAPSSTPEDRTPYPDTVIGGDEDFVVIELGGSDACSDEGQSQSQRLCTRHERVQSTGSSAYRSISPSPWKKRRSSKLHKMTSMGDELIDIRSKDDEFSIQPIRRSISMDSSADRQLFVAVQEILQQKRDVIEEAINSNNQEGCSSSSSSRMRRTFFSFGHGRASRSAVQPICLEP